MPTTSLDLPEMLNRFVENEVDEGRYTSKAEAIRYLIRRDMQRQNSVNEKLSKEAVESIQRARGQEDEGDIRESIEE